MELSQELMGRIEATLERLEQLDPAELPEPAGELATLLGDLLDELEQG